METTRPRRKEIGGNVRHCVLLLTLCVISPAWAQEHGNQSMTADFTNSDIREDNMGEMPMDMHGLYGDYPMTRESSGTAWVPDSSPMEGIRGMYGEWTTMLHGSANLVYDRQGGRRGDDKALSQSMLMAMARRPLAQGTLGLRSMLSLDALMGKSGYPLLFQTGETADGKTPLIDRQHPHDLFMELATSYSQPVADNSSAFVYIGYPGEPALGPPTFMHRFSGMDNPEAPLGHHWLDSTHITFGVATAGYVWRNWKAELSAFNGRAPDEQRWNFDDPRFSSYAGRISYNPTDNWALQASHGSLKSPEQLEPDIDQRRTTASAIYDLTLDQYHWQVTFAWGKNNTNSGSNTDAFLLESAIRLYDRHTVFGRAEHVEKDELFEAPDPFVGETINIGKLSVGYVYDIPIAEHVSFGLGGLASGFRYPDRTEPAYGDDPMSYMVFVRLKLL